MKQLYVLFNCCIIFFFITSAEAQQFRWLTGGGSTDNINNGIAQGEWITHMCTDDNGNVYSLAQVGENDIKADTFFQSAAAVQGDWNILFMSHDCNGNMRFSKLIESNSTNLCHGITYSAGKIYVAGTLYNTGRRIGYDATLAGMYQFSFTSKFDTSGTYEWTRFIGPDEITTLQGAMSVGSVSVDGQGNIHRFSTMRAGVKITPSITSQWGSYDLKYDPAGNLLSVNKLQSIDSGYYVAHAEIDKLTNKCYVLFNLTGGTTTRSYNALLAYNPNGTMIWKDTTNVRNSINNIRIAPNKSIYFVGSGSLPFPFSIKGTTVNNSIATTGTGAMTIIGKLDIQTGNPIWIYHMDGLNAVNGFADLELLPDYTISAFGYYGGYKKYRNDTLSSPSGANYRPMIFAIDSSGVLLDWKYMEGTGFYNYGLKITSDKKGNVYMGGEVPKDIKADKLPQYSSNGGNSDFFIAKFGYDCNCAAMANPSSGFTYTIKDSLKKELQFTFTGTQPNDSVVWRFGDGSVLTANNPAYAFPDSGLFTVCAKVMVPCGRKVVCMDVYVPYKDTTKPVDTTDTTDHVMMVNAFNQVKIYPNPASDIVTVEGIDAGHSIAVFDMTGRVLFVQKATGRKEQMHIGDLPAGNYILQLTNNNGQRMQAKVVKR